jgi:hypothetical protein
MKKVNDKIRIVCQKKGWLGMKTLKNYIKNTFKMTKTPKANLKYLLTNFGIFLTDQEMDSIFSIYDRQNKDEVLYETFLNDLIVYVKII